MSALMARMARLDADQVFWGLGDPVPLDQVPTGAFVFGDPAIVDALKGVATWIDRDCDLPGGRYKLVGPDGKQPNWRFEPLPVSLQKTTEAAPDLERAFYEMCKALQTASGAIAPASLAWCLAYERSFDAVAAPGVDAPSPLALTFFRDLAKGA